MRLLTAAPALSLEGPAFRPRLDHEIKHDGFRILAQHDGAGVRLDYSRGVCQTPPAFKD